MIPAILLASHHLATRPELAILAVLAAAIRAVEATLWCEHPELDWDPDPPGSPHSPAEPCYIANSILILTSELQSEIHRYWVAADGGQLELPYEPALEPGPARDSDLQARLLF